MILAGIGKRIPRTDHVGIANDDEISKVNHLFNDTTLHLHALPYHVVILVFGMDSRLHEWSVG